MKNEKNIEIILTGGLGNQMFQYSAGIGLSKKLKAENVYLNTDMLPNLSGLSSFSLLPNVFYGTPKSKKSYLFQRESKNKFIEKKFFFDCDIFSVSLPVTLEGYFQSPKYFMEATEDIENSFKLKEPLKMDGSLESKFHSGCPLVALHMRRGDYFSNESAKKIHGTLGYDYFTRAIKIMKSLIPTKPTFVVFSDDIEYAKTLNDLDLDLDLIFIEPRMDNAANDLVLMSICSHFIISNSTYSWWAAYLGGRSSGIIVSPINWFSRDFLLQNPAYDLFPPGWIFI